MNIRDDNIGCHSEPFDRLRAKNPMGFWDSLFSCILASLLCCFFVSCQPKQHVASARDKKTMQVVEEVMNGSRKPVIQPMIRLAPVHFPFASDDLSEEEFAMLASNVEWLENNPRAVLVLEGHCDERGRDLYNMELGDRRARRIKTHLIKNGIAADRLIMVISYGEKLPLDPRHTLDAWRANRRVEFIVR